MLNITGVLILFSSVYLSACGEDPLRNNPQPNNTDTSFVAYVIVTPSGGTPDTLVFTDCNQCQGTYLIANNRTYVLLNDTASGINSSVSFEGNSIGSPAFTFGYITYNGNGLNASSVSGTIALYEAVGGKIKGTFSGIYSDGTTSYQCSGVFNVTRRQDT